MLQQRLESRSETLKEAVSVQQFERELEPPLRLLWLGVGDEVEIRAGTDVGIAVVGVAVETGVGLSEGIGVGSAVGSKVEARWFTKRIIMKRHLQIHLKL